MVASFGGVVWVRFPAIDKFKQRGEDVQIQEDDTLREAMQLHARSLWRACSMR
jgi:hypothetical protein